jgi:hypothetical protein
MDCIFSNPVNYLDASPTSEQMFQFKSERCTTTEPIYSLIQNTSTEAEFYVEKTLSYGDLILIVFLSIFLIFGIFKFLWNFIQQNWNSKL